MYEVPLLMSLLGFGMGTMLANFHMCVIMLELRAIFSMLVWNKSVCLVCCVYDNSQYFWVWLLCCF